MILEELCGSFVALVSTLVIHTPSMSRENINKTEYTLIFEENQERQEISDGLIHCEYEPEPPTPSPYYEEVTSVFVQADQHPQRSFCQSLIRSCKTNLTLVIAVIFILGLLTTVLVYVDLNTTNVCVAWTHNNFTLPLKEQNMRIVGMMITLFPLFAWFPTYVMMLWGFKKFKNYALFLFILQLVALSTICVYKYFFYDKISGSVEYRFPGNVIFVLSIVCCAYLVAHKYKKVNQGTSYTVCRVFVILSFAFLSSCLIAYIYVYVIITFFEKIEDRTKKAIIAALTPGITMPVTAAAKYIVLRKSSEIIAPDRAFVLCYFIRGGSIVLYRTMQSDFQDIWVFVGLSLLHGISNVLSKATLGLRIKIWKCFIKHYNEACCGPKLKVQALNSPRTRRLNADIEIQNILFEYSTVILSQTYLACYFVMSFDVPAWLVLKDSLMRIAISLAIDFVFNILSVCLQIHFYDIPMQKVWVNYWQRHVTANAVMMIIVVSYFGASLVRVFASNDSYINTQYKLKNCTSMF